MRKTHRLYLNDIHEAIDRIEEYLNGRTFEEFSKNTLVIDAVIRNFEIIGEAAKQIPLEIKTENPLIKWKEMSGMRDKLAHEYFGVNIEILWKTAKNRLPVLKPLIKELLAKSEKNETK